jgi:arylformamidase
VAELLDVTVPLRPGRVPLYPGDAPFELESVSSIADGDPSNNSKLTCSVHSGTHVDAPVHFLPGAGGIETVPLDALVGPAYVVDATHVTAHIDGPALDTIDIPENAERVLFRTSNSRLWADAAFHEDFVALAPDAAAALVERGVRLVGIDYLSIAPYGDPAPTHETLLRAGVAVVEALDLREAEPGPYDLTCLPALLVGSDGAPARVVLARA